MGEVRGRYPQVADLFMSLLHERGEQTRLYLHLKGLGLRVSSSSPSQWAGGTHRPGRTTIFAIAERYKVDASALAKTCGYPEDDWHRVYEDYKSTQIGRHNDLTSHEVLAVRTLRESGRSSDALALATDLITRSGARPRGVEQAQRYLDLRLEQVNVRIQARADVQRAVSELLDDARRMLPCLIAEDEVWERYTNDVLYFEANAAHFDHNHELAIKQLRALAQRRGRSPRVFKPLALSFAARDRADDFEREVRPHLDEPASDHDPMSRAIMLEGVARACGRFAERGKESYLSLAYELLEAAIDEVCELQKSGIAERRTSLSLPRDAFLIAASDHTVPPVALRRRLSGLGIGDVTHGLDHVIQQAFEAGFERIVADLRVVPRNLVA
jgi:hypothetical protein